jgi:hypothetical protein
MQRVKRKEAISRGEYHSRLRKWHAETNEQHIGEFEKGKRVPPWIFIRDGKRLFSQDADASREVVGEYLKLLDQQGEDLRWTVVLSDRGYKSRVAPGNPPERIPVYIYLRDPKPTRPN